MHVGAGQVVAVIGPNGAGRAPPEGDLGDGAGSIPGEWSSTGGRHRGPLEKLARLGFGYVPQLDDVFEGLRVRENLDMGGYLANQAKASIAWSVRSACFRSSAEAESLRRDVEWRRAEDDSDRTSADARPVGAHPRRANGGPLARALEVRAGDQVRALGDLGKAVLLVEQKAVAALGIANWAYMLVRGEVVMSADAKEVLDDRTCARSFSAPGTERGRSRARPVAASARSPLQPEQLLGLPCRIRSRSASGMSIARTARSSSTTHDPSSGPNGKSVPNMMWSEPKKPSARPSESVEPLLTQSL